MKNMFSLEGRVALVTGAAGGLGSRFCRVLAGAGAHVMLVGRRHPPLQELARELAASGMRVHAISADVTDESGIHACLDEAQQVAGSVVDIALCNAGATLTQPALQVSEQDWDRIMAVNLKGCWMTATAVARRLVQAGQGGTIINISSILGHRVAGGVLPYTVSKAAVEHMTRALALEWARHDIRVNALAPGYIETDLNRDFFASEPGRAMIKRIPQRRLGQAQDLDGALLLLASDASRYMTGSSIVVDGGHLQSTV